MRGITRIIPCSAAASRAAVAINLLKKCSLSSLESCSTRPATRKNDTKKWDMLRKQEHIYATMFTSGEVSVENHGTPQVADALVEALRLQWAYGHPYTPKGFPLLTHAFHAYPAGMQPAAARHLLETVLPGTSVLDPFVGGGTVVLEAMRAGRVAVGSDISPLALFVSRGRCWTSSDDELDRLREASRSIASTAAAKICGGASRPASGADWEVVKAAIGDYLADEETWPGFEVERALWFVFAVARSRGAKARWRRPTNGRPPFVADRYFQSVCTEYASAIAGLTRATTAAAAPYSPPQALLVYRDARQPVPPSSSSATQQPSADREEPAPPGVKDTATENFVAEAEETEQERIATAAASIVPRGETGRGKALELEEREGFPLSEGLPIGNSSAGAVVGDSSIIDSAAGAVVGDSSSISSAAGVVVGGSAAGVIGESAAGKLRDSSATGVEGIPAGMVFDAVLTSPPYPGVYDYLGHARSARSQLGALPRPHMTPSRPADSTSGRRPGDRLADAVTVVDEVNENDLAACRGKGETETDVAACQGGVSVFIDSAVPSGRDWPSNWTDGEIGAKSEVRRRARRNAAFSGMNSTETGPTGVSLGEAGLQAVKGGEISGLGRKWADDQKEWLVATTRVLRSGGGRIAVMVGDGGGVDTRSSLLEGVKELGRREGEGGSGLGLRVVGWATLRAARDARRSMRTEHLVLLERS